MNDTLRISITNTNLSTILDGNSFKIVLICLLSSLSIFTVGGNLLVLYALQTEKHLRTVSNLFILSLAVADLAVGLFVMPLSAATVVAGRWVFSSFVCKMWLSIDYVASTASIFNLVLLSLDRYWAVVYPLRYLQKRTRRRATIFILIAWFISSLWAPAVIFWSHINPKQHDIIEENECDTSFRSNKTFKTLTALVNFYIPLLSMIILSYRIMAAIRLRSKMQLGRRLSSATQKQMKLDYTYSIEMYRNNIASNDDYNDISPSPINVDQVSEVFPLEIKSNDENNCNQKNHTSIERFSQCPTCKKCHTYEKSVCNEGLWQVRSGIKHQSSLKARQFPFIHIRPLSMIFLSAKTNKNFNLNLHKSSSDSGQMMRSCSNDSNQMKYSRTFNFNNDKDKSLPIRCNPRLGSKTSSVQSSFSDECQQKPYLSLHEKEYNIKSNGKLTTQSSTIINDASSTNSFLRLSSIQQDSINSRQHNLSTSTQVDDTTKMNFFNFFNTLINPSRSRSLQKEFKAAKQLGMLVCVFTISWLPYFVLFLVVAWCNDCISNHIYTASIWLGYLNSTLNPLIYPLCNVHFRRAFQKILYCKHSKIKLPNLYALNELHALYATNRRR